MTQGGPSTPEQPDPDAETPDWSPVGEDPARFPDIPPPVGRHAKPIADPADEPFDRPYTPQHGHIPPSRPLEPYAAPAEPPSAEATPPEGLDRMLGTYTAPEDVRVAGAVRSPLRGLSAEPTEATPLGEAERRAEESLEEAWANAVGGLPPGEFLRMFARGVTWKAMLVVADGAFPGLGLPGVLGRRVDELLGAAFWPSGGDAGVPVPVWADASGLALDLSVQFAGVAVQSLGGRSPRAAGEPGWMALGVRSREEPSGFRQRHHGVLVIDTLNPRSLYRPFGGPVQPDDEPAAHSGPADPADGPDAGVVIVADLRGAGSRVVNADSLWRYACQTVTSALYDPVRPDSWAQTRDELRALRHVAYLDPSLGLGLAVHVDVTRRPFCPLGFTVEEDSVTGQATVRMLWP